MNLYMVHCGFYDPNLADGIYESHTNFFVAAESFEDARAKAKLIPEYKARKMHVDGLQEIELVDGYRMNLVEDKNSAGQTRIINVKHRDLAPKPATT